ncbi:MAG TPA: Rieske 2Fe-2S domain-containing protein [Mycobacteriales bacterium]|nr:Rieske 2Fe-2S domain-containing protein [Mycobacteriales bacterium]
MTRPSTVSPPPQPGRVPAPAPPLLGPHWRDQRFRQTGWVLLPLRGFLAVTFVVAGLQKLANPAYFDSNNPISFAATMHALQHASPIVPLLSLSEHAPGPVGLLIALGELAVGIGMLIGLWTRLAAAGGLLLSLTFFLTVSWNTAPYYYGSDIVFVFAWTPFVLAGAAGVLSLDAIIQARAQALYARARRGIGGPLTVDTATDLDRRRLVMGMRAAALAAAGTGVLAVVTAVLGRMIGGTSTSNAASTRPLSPPSTTATTRRHKHNHHNPAGTLIGPASAVPKGQAQMFRDPSNGRPAYVVHEPDGKFSAFSAVCTHAGCTVGFDASAQEFICPCHGGTYSARTGQVLAGPPPAPLSPINVAVSAGEIRVV